MNSLSNNSPYDATHFTQTDYSYPFETSVFAFKTYNAGSQKTF